VEKIKVLIKKEVECVLSSSEEFQVSSILFISFSLYFVKFIP